MQGSVSSNPNTAGARLRQARTARGLSLEDVAQSLRLAPRIISALEEDAYDRLPSPTYVRGYLRSYAMLLGLSPQELIDSFNNTPQAAQRADMTAPTPVRQVTSSDATVRFGTLLVVGLVIGLSVLWWSGNDGSATRRSTAPAIPAPSETQPAYSPEAEEVPAAVADVPAKAVEPAVTLNEKPAPAPAAAPAPVAATVSVDPNAPRARLLLRVTEDSWADVRDAGQQRLLYETLPAGRTVTVEGVAPLSVFLGNVEGVTVEFDGKPYDALRHRRGQVARFTLGSTGSN